MDLGEVIYRNLAGGMPSGAEPRTLRQALDWLVDRAGSVSAAARSAGVPRRTMRDWISGKHQPRGPRRDAIVRTALEGERARRLSDDRARRLRQAGPSGIHFHGRYAYQPVPRHVRIGRYMLPDTMDRIVTAYQKGASPDQLRMIFAAGIDDPSGFYPRTLGLPPSHQHGWGIDKVEFGE